mmetsp:Transcript_23229/g.25799  ORF Transcript_23229/g.25799 Transcript_23229/m.25799 type:complete len:259 (-) Transcript_23229:19-795(-)
MFFTRTILILILYVVFVTAFPPDCSNIVYGGKKYDLSGLQAQGLITAKPAGVSFYDYRFFICGPKGFTCGTNTGPDTCGVCSAWEGNWNDLYMQSCHGLYVEDSFKFREAVPDGIELLLSNGDGSSKTDLILICDPGYEGFSNVEIDNQSSYHVKITVRTKEACSIPSSGVGGLSVGSILLIVFFVGVILYIIGGVAWNKLKEKKPWSDNIELLPNFNFWKQVPGLTLDGIMFIINKIRGVDGEYGSIPERQSEMSHM